ncbi:phage regulatory CII family protein [Deefgea piscis]|uniref:phage regulatory CII family protein n=1 Tax=Deefgea piscis TaxID=2739061 RepID=UPI001C7FA1C5|nr:phage regulatory CII family protein [Deefgea piscis]QZA80873.1 phage regulatory CII family protein [Deefgea piscis]
MKALPPNNFAEAAQAVIHDYGVAALAGLMGMPVSTLYNKANPHDTQAQLTAAEVAVITSITRDLRMMKALSHATGGAFFVVPKLDHVPDTELLDLVGEVGIKKGIVHSEMSKAFADRVLQRHEFNAIDRAANDLHGAVAVLLGRLEGMIDE